MKTPIKPPARRYTRRITALLLTLIVAFGIVPPLEVSAHVQSPVGRPAGAGISPIMRQVPSPPPGQYNFTLQWIWNNAWGANPAPPDSRPGVVHPPPPDNDALRGQPWGFDIAWRNATTPEMNFNYRGPGAMFGPAGRLHPGNDPLQRTATLSDIGVGLTPNSIYSFQVVPWHIHRQYNTVTLPGGGTSWSTADTYWMPPRAAMNEMLFLTDIDVRLSHGPTGGIQVTWNNPTFDGNQVFQSYSILFRSLPPANPDFWTPGTTVFADSPGLQGGEGSPIWSYEFTYQNIFPGINYEVRVVPNVQGGTPIHATNAVDIPGVGVRDIAFSGRDFISEQPIYVRPGLTRTLVGPYYMTLNWTPPFGHVRRINIWQWTMEPGQIPADDFEPNLGNANLVHSIMGYAAGNATSHLVRRPPPPQQPSWFQVEFEVEFPDGRIVTMFTNAVVYDPRFDDFEAYAPTIRYIDHGPRPRPASAPIHLDITWRAFTRPVYRGSDIHDFRVAGDTFIFDGEWIIDNDLVYYVYITDQPHLMMPGAWLPPVNRDGLPAPLTLVEFFPSLEPIFVNEIWQPPIHDYFYNFQFYYFIGAGGEVLPIVGNRIYYIRIVAVRPEDGTTMGDFFTSLPAYGVYFVPPVDPLDMVPLMVPVRVKEDEDGVRVIGDDYITIEWNTRWFEVYDVDTNRWYDTVGLAPATATSPGGIVFGRTADNLPPDYRRRLWNEQEFTPTTLASATSYIQGWLGAGVPVRLMDTGPSHITDHLIHVVGYDDMSEMFPGAVDPYDLYLQTIRHATHPHGPLPGAWTPIGMGTEREDSSGRRRFHEVSSLRLNTSYVIFFWPENQVGNAYHPSYTTGTTTDDRDDLEIYPTVPILRVERNPIEGITRGTTDTTITLSWNGSIEMEYQLRMSELLADMTNTPPAGDIIIDFGDDLEEMGVVARDGRLYFTVDGLFPYTMYHFRIQAQVDTRQSVWSNPVSERTLDILPPQPPSGLRIASSMSLSAYNTENNTTYRTGEHDQLILEWNRIFADIHNVNPGPPQTGYDVDSHATNYNARWMDSPSLETTYMALIEGLVANRRYHVRIWTVLTVTRGGDTGIIRSYSYRMQVSATEDFADYIEIIIPSLDPLDPNPSQMRRIESLTYHYRWFFSGQTYYEYDGYRDPEQYPVPDRDWDITYDPGTSTLTFRFRSNQIDATGARDQNADQRFISRLIQQRTFVYSLDLSLYNNRPVANAVVEMPWSIMNAFRERQIALELTMNNVHVTFTPGSLETAEMLALQGVGPSTTTRLMVHSAFDQAPALSAGGSYASVPRRVTAEIETAARTIRFEDFAQPLQLAFTLDGLAMMMDQNIGLYTSTMWTPGWERLAATHNPVTGRLEFPAFQSGNFAAIAQAAPAQAMPDHPSRDAFLRVNARVSITDMPVFNPGEVVSGNAFNNMVAAVVFDRSSVALNGALTPADAQSLTRGRLYVSGATVSREAAMASLVTLYELGIGRSVQPMNLAGPPDLAGANPANHLALLKAADLGFFTGAARPTDALTMGDFMVMLDIIIMDRG